MGDDAEVATDARELGLVGAGLGLEAGDLEGGPGPGRELTGLVVGAQVEGDAADTGGVVGEAEVGDEGGEAAAKDPCEDHARAGQRGGGLGVDLGELVGIAGDRQEALGLDGEQGGGLLGAVGEEVEVLAAAAPGDAAQARGVGPQARDDGVDRCTPAVRAVIVGAVVEQAVAAQQPGVDLGVGSPGVEGGGAVEQGVLEGAAQLGPVAAVDREALGRLGGVAQADQQHGEGAGDRSQVAAEEVELAGQVARAAGAGGVPHDAEGARAQARAGARGEGLLGPEVVEVAEALGGDRGPAALGERQLELAARGEVLAGDLEDMSLGPGGEAQAEGVGGDAGGTLAVADGEAQGEAAQGG